MWEYVYKRPAGRPGALRQAVHSAKSRQQKPTVKALPEGTARAPWSHCCKATVMDKNSSSRS